MPGARWVVRKLWVRPRGISALIVFPPVISGEDGTRRQCERSTKERGRGGG